jgi:hypothetical protein
MRSFANLKRSSIAGAALVAMALTPALAMPFAPNVSTTTATNYPGAPRPVYDDNKAPYAMNYADEAVQNLGFRNGHMDVFSTKPAGNSYLPAFSGGIDAGGAMLRLQWHPGE